jgi:pilus assembly protein CpaE
VAFFLKINSEFSLLDALSQMGDSGEPDWSSLVVASEGIDVLPAPDTSEGGAIDPDRLHDALESVRELYDWIVVDLPSIYEKISLLTMSDCDEAFLVSTSELPSLHLTRKAVAYLGGVGFGMERYRVLVNRLAKQENITSDDMAKIFGAPVHATFPNDYLSIHKGLTVGAPLGPKCPLGKSVDSFAGQIAARALAEKKKTAAQLN